jgi:hypothetical protein
MSYRPIGAREGCVAVGAELFSPSTNKGAVRPFLEKNMNFANFKLKFSCHISD